MNRKFKGIPTSGGIAIGKAYVIGKEEFSLQPRRLSPADIAHEILKFEEALIQTRKELIELQKEVAQKLDQDHAQIFDAHLMVLEDRVLIEEVITRIKNNKLNVEYAFSQVIKKYSETLSKLKDEYLKERVVDVQDVGRRVLRKLLKKEKKDSFPSQEKVIVVVSDLSPADAISLPKKNILGFATDIGGRTSHTAIIARALGIPAVVGLGKFSSVVSSGDLLIMDGNQGLIILNPSQDLIASYEKKKVEERRRKRFLLSLKDLPAQTKDGRRISLGANIELPEEIPLVSEWGAEGIGLYRTEFVYLGRKELPSEEEQYRVYLEVAKKVAPHSVIIRTLDLGGDKFLSQPVIPKSMSSSLGWRAIRFCLARPEIFKMQLRAILRASQMKNLKIMFPLISGVEELIQAKKILEETKKELAERSIPFDKDLEIGAMIEVPSAALISDILARQVDFFSIGTNDLIQYSVAVDRANEKVAYLYEPTHPGVLRLIKLIIDNAHKENIWVGMCGEMSAEPLYAFILVGMGVDELSVPPPAVPQIKRLIRSVKLSEAKEVVKKIFSLPTSRKVEETVTHFLKKSLGDKFEEILGGVPL